MSGLKKNVIYQTAYHILKIVLPLVTSPYIARVLGAENLGLSGYTYAVVYYFVMASMLGISNYGNRAIAVDRDDRIKLNRTFSSILLLHIIISALVVIAFIVYLFVIGNDKGLFLIQGIYIIAATFDISWLFFGLEKFKITVTGNVIIKILTVICIFAFVRNSNDLPKYVFIMAFGTLLSQLYLWFFTFSEVKIVKPTVNEILVHVKPMFILFIPVLAISLYKMMDKVMLGSFSEKSEVGFYNNSEKAIDIPLSVIGAFGTVMLPKMSNIMKSGVTQTGKKYMDLSVKYIMLIAMAMAFGIAAVAPTFSEVFWGEEFIPCGILIKCLAITIPFLAFANILRTQFLIPLKRDKEYIISVFAGAIINFIVNLCLIPICGALGAAVGTVFAEAAVCIVQSYYVLRELSFAKYLKQLFVYIIFGIIMYMITIVSFNGAKASVMTLLLEIVLGGGVYSICSFVFLLVTKDKLVGQIIHRRNK